MHELTKFEYRKESTSDLQRGQSKSMEGGKKKDEMRVLEGTILQAIIYRKRFFFVVVVVVTKIEFPKGLLGIACEKRGWGE
jgi:hypothetical protein